MVLDVLCLEACGHIESLCMYLGELSLLLDDTKGLRFISSSPYIHMCGPHVAMVLFDASRWPTEIIKHNIFFTSNTFLF